MLNRINKFLVIVNAIILLAIFYSPAVIRAQTATAPSGSGTSGDPYKIATLNNLYWLSQTTSAWATGIYFIQTADIDASSTSGWASGAGFSPIGNSTTFFEGNYNGNGHTIDGLYINRPSTAKLGLFGTILGSTLKNLGVTNVNINGGTDQIGGLLGVDNTGSIISECYSTGTVTSNGTSVGGIIGYNNSNCTVSDCYSTVSISGSGSAFVGGLVGQNLSSGGTVSNCYAVGSVTSSATDLGGFCGSNKGSITGSFWNTDIMATGIGYGTTTGATGKSSLQMQTESTFTNAGWDFQGETTNGTNDIWGINIVNNSEYPFLSWQGYVAAIMPNGSGTSSDPYQIATLDNLYWMSQDSASLSKYFKQTADIDASSSSGWSGRGFPKFVFLFSGTYDGAGHTISGIYINDTTDKYGGDGLFMYIWAGTVKNLGLINVNMYAHNGSGAFAGLLEGGTIENCYSTGIVKGDSAVGGIVGFSAANNDSTPPSLPPLIPVKITGCYSTATVEATEYGAGGIVGQTYNGSGDSTWIEITNCYSTSGIVSSPIGAGGIVGYLDRAILNTSYSTGDVYCPFDAGGIAGISTTHSTISNCFFKGYFNFGAGLDDGGIVGANAGEIKNCYAVFSYYLTPGVDEATNHIGGLVGLNDNGTSNNSFWDTTYWGLTYSALGTGLTTTQMKTSSTFLNAGWDSSIWYRENSYNSGYPYLAWQNPGGAPLPVELTSFTAAINENKVELNWKTATEVNNYGFEIQRRNTPIQFPSREGKEQSDRGVWKKVGFVKGSGTSTSPITYSFVDNNPLHGKTEYRLKQENYDGTFKYSSIISVNVLPVKFVLYQNYPNPFNPTTTIKYSLAKAEHVTLKVYDELGREVKTLVDGNKEAGRYSVDFNGSGLASGVYYYRIKAGNFNEVKKLILLK